MKTVFYLVILFIAGLLFIPNKDEDSIEYDYIDYSLSTEQSETDDEEELVQTVIDTDNEINKTIGDIEKNYTYISYKQNVLKVAQPFFMRYGNHYTIVREDSTIVYEGYLKNFKKTKLYTIGGLFTFDIYKEALLGEPRIQDKTHILTKTIKL